MEPLGPLRRSVYSAIDFPHISSPSTLCMISPTSAERGREQGMERRRERHVASDTTRRILSILLAGNDRLMALRDQGEGANLRILPVCAAEPVASIETITWYPAL